MNKDLREEHVVGPSQGRKSKQKLIRILILLQGRDCRILEKEKHTHIIHCNNTTIQYIRKQLYMRLAALEYTYTTQEGGISYKAISQELLGPPSYHL